MVTILKKKKQVAFNLISSSFCNRIHKLRVGAGGMKKT